MINKAEPPADLTAVWVCNNCSLIWYFTLSQRQPGEGYLLDRTTSSARSTGPVSGCSITWSPDFTLRLVWAHFWRPTFPPGNEATGQPKHTCRHKRSSWRPGRPRPDDRNHQLEANKHVNKKRRTPLAVLRNWWAGRVVRCKRWPPSLSWGSAGLKLICSFWAFCRQLWEWKTCWGNPSIRWRQDRFL